jgi:hypothetical protein
VVFEQLFDEWHIPVDKRLLFVDERQKQHMEPLFEKQKLKTG